MIFIVIFSLDDVGITFEEATYTVSEGEPIVEACVVTSATPEPGQTIAALVSTEDGTAIGMTIWREGVYHIVGSLGKVLILASWIKITNLNLNLRHAYDIDIDHSI